MEQINKYLPILAVILSAIALAVALTYSGGQPILGATPTAGKLTSTTTVKAKVWREGRPNDYHPAGFCYEKYDVDGNLVYEFIKDNIVYYKSTCD